MFTSNIFANIIVSILAMVTYGIVKTDYTLLKMAILGLIVSFVIVIVVAVAMLVFNKKKPL
ncbi:hypothetical protein [Paenibacillus polymyxa]|uniref:Uncharacterized protein n=1 Tax=Paenibacillus polymyxa (strain SC2) TaxID=886882 RepID=E3EJW9_PAEPS|nr:hypothetical protein [Paenibacillus polymyxa]ADO59988.1 hypothetical protein PPSC2_28245 [Paenibacillus polymyxa SC2]WPQ59795.1 hypothetical protein SKN87_26260 [Paenibacillus polymyxa]